MADAKQAGIWMEQGKAVRRPYLHPSVSVAQKLGNVTFSVIRVLEDGKLARDGRAAIFLAEDFIAEDWEIAP